MVFTMFRLPVLRRPPYLELPLGLPDCVVAHGGDLGGLGLEGGGRIGLGERGRRRVPGMHR